MAACDDPETVCLYERLAILGHPVEYDFKVGGQYLALYQKLDSFGNAGEKTVSVFDQRRLETIDAGILIDKNLKPSFLQHLSEFLAGGSADRPNQRLDSPE